MRAAIYTLGCKVNQYETQAMEQEMRRRGHELVDFEDSADAYIINTCSVTAVSDKKSRQMIRRARRRSPGAVVAACGCYVQTHTDEAKTLGIDLIGGTGDRMAFLDLLEQEVRDRTPRVAVDDSLRRRSFEVLPAGGLAARTRAMLKVEDGCVNFCTYCIIPFARGPVRSLPMDQAVAQTRQLQAEGYRELVFTGIEISSWGQDLHDGTPAAAAAGEPGAPDHHRGLLPPGGGSAQPVPPFPPVPAVRLRRHPASDEPPVRHRPVPAVRGPAAAVL